ncbi:hypothetical protein ABMA27_012174 [Loxostege sticticalis]|uniref:Uncharacterized protein n=1 Tax=Loxostege sticticalis TaxID=481309 RepID=A0ABR3H151_LOXSC
MPLHNSFDCLTVDSDDDDSSCPATQRDSRCTKSYLDIDLNDIEILRKAILELQNKLCIKDKELENQQVTNFALKKQINKYETQIKELTQKYKSSPKTTTNNNTLKHVSEISEMLKAVKSKISKLLEELNNINQDLELLSREISYTEQTNNNNARDFRTSIKNKTRLEKNKMCFLSTNRNNNILSIAEQFFSKDYNLCHYLMPNVDLKQLLKGIGSKLANFTENDFCVILIGHQDFTTTRDYTDIILHLRKTLQEHYNTNIIICLPTFKCCYNTSMFNQRIEHFNSLLYLDNISQEYAYLLDSNLHLEYDKTMFNRRNGVINNNGMRVVFTHLSEMINGILSYYNTFSKNSGNNTENNQQLENSITRTPPPGTSTPHCFFRV